MQLKMGNFLFSPTLIPTLVFITLLGMLLSLGNWQINRAHEKKALIDATQNRKIQPVLALSEINTIQPTLDRFRLANAKGKYIAGQQWLLDNRVYQGISGYHVFSLFQLNNGEKILINRGWVSTGLSRQTLPELPLPEGNINLSGYLDLPEPVALTLGNPLYERNEPLTLVQNLDINTLSNTKNLDLFPLALVIHADQQSALQFDGSPNTQLSPEKHWGYAVQWFSLAIALVIIYFGVNTCRLRDGAKTCEK